MYTKLIVHPNSKLHSIDIHNHYHKLQNLEYFNPSTIGRIVPKIYLVALTPHQLDLATLPTHFTHPTHLKNPTKGSYTRTTHSQARNLQSSPQKLNSAYTNPVALPTHPIYHTHLKNPAKGSPTATSHMQTDHLQVIPQKPNPTNIKPMSLPAHLVHLPHLTNPAKGNPTPSTYTQKKHLKSIPQETNSANIAYLEYLQSPVQNICRILPKILNPAPIHTWDTITTSYP
jgi:hypothetical protein